jgi:hypothetical protein
VRNGDFGQLAAVRDQVDDDRASVPLGAEIDLRAMVAKGRAEKAPTRIVSFTQA